MPINDAFLRLQTNVTTGTPLTGTNSFLHSLEWSGKPAYSWSVQSVYTVPSTITDTSTPAISVHWADGDLTIPDGLCPTPFSGSFRASEVIDVATIWPNGQTLLSLDGLDGFASDERHLPYHPPVLYGRPGSPIGRPKCVRFFICRDNWGGDDAVFDQEEIGHRQGDLVRRLIPSTSDGLTNSPSSGPPDSDPILCFATAFGTRDFPERFTPEYDNPEDHPDRIPAGVPSEYWTEDSQKEQLAAICEFTDAYRAMVETLKEKFPTVLFQVIPRLDATEHVIKSFLAEQQDQEFEKLAMGDIPGQIFGRYGLTGRIERTEGQTSYSIFGDVLDIVVISKVGYSRALIGDVPFGWSDYLSVGFTVFATSTNLDTSDESSATTVLAADRPSNAFGKFTFLRTAPASEVFKSDCLLWTTYRDADVLETVAEENLSQCLVAFTGSIGNYQGYAVRFAVDSTPPNDYEKWAFSGLLRRGVSGETYPHPSGRTWLNSFSLERTGVAYRSTSQATVPEYAGRGVANCDDAVLPYGIFTPSAELAGPVDETSNDGDITGTESESCENIFDNMQDVVREFYGDRLPNALQTAGIDAQYVGEIASESLDVEQFTTIISSHFGIPPSVS